MNSNITSQLSDILSKASIINIESANELLENNSGHQQISTLIDEVKLKNKNVIVVIGDLEETIKATELKDGLIVRVGVFQDLLEIIQIQIKKSKEYINEGRFLNMLTNPELAECLKVNFND